MNFELCEYSDLIIQGNLSLQIKLWLMGNQWFQHYFQEYCQFMNFEYNLLQRYCDLIEENPPNLHRILQLFKKFYNLRTFNLYNNSENIDYILEHLPSSVQNLYIDQFNFEKYFLLPQTLITLKVDILYAYKVQIYKLPHNLKYLEVRQYHNFLDENLHMPKHLETLKSYNLKFENKWLKSLKKLKTLQIHANHTLNFYFLELDKKLKHLTNLDLSHNYNLYNVNNLLHYCNNLQKLILVYDKLYSIPDNIANLSLLTYLNLSNNKIVNVVNDDIFKNLTSLTYLNLSDNQILYLPTSIMQLTQLKDLQLQFNQLTDDSFCLFSKMSQLENLYLSNNYFVNITTLFSPNLKCLDLGWNQLKQLPHNICELKNLVVLYLNCNQLSNVDELFNTKLQYLNLSENNLHNLSNNITNLPSLYTLNLFSNKLTSFPLITNSLNYLNLQNNCFLNDVKTLLCEHFAKNKILLHI